MVLLAWLRPFGRALERGKTGREFDDDGGTAGATLCPGRVFYRLEFPALRILAAIILVGVRHRHGAHVNDEAVVLA